VPAYDKYGRGNQFNWNLFSQNLAQPGYAGTPAGLVFSTDSAQDPYGKAFTASHWATFSPRLGLVWDPKGDGKQTIRASFNYNHDTTMLFYPERWTTNAPYVSSILLSSGQFSNPFSGLRQPRDRQGGRSVPRQRDLPAQAPTSPFPGTCRSLA